MKKYNLYKPAKHPGELPVRVLILNVQDCFENITTDFRDEFKSEVLYNGFNKTIKYHINRIPIKEVALINSSKQIELFENFNQYLWSICYSAFVLFNEWISKPNLNKSFKAGFIDLDNTVIKEAVQILNNGIDLITKYVDTEFFKLPNPESYTENDKSYIEQANGIFTTAMSFIILHEFGHQYYSHLDFHSLGEEAKLEEYVADNYAIEKISSNFSTNMKDTYKYGVVFGLCSLIILDNSLDGGDTHPDLDERLTSALNKLNLEDTHELWGMASFVIRLWFMKYNKEINIPNISKNYKELYVLQQFSS
jgi:Peptidase U49